jgi:hypothetical protein
LNWSYLAPSVQSGIGRRLVTGYGKAAHIPREFEQSDLFGRSENHVNKRCTGLSHGRRYRVSRPVILWHGQFGRDQAFSFEGGSKFPFGKSVRVVRSAEQLGDLTVYSARVVEIARYLIVSAFIRLW